jgi:outer membrane lipoprotein-sorting protein
MSRLNAVLMSFCVLTMVVVFSGTATALPTIDELLAKMQKNMAGITTFEADLKMTAAQGDRKMISNGHIVSKNIMKDDKTIEKTLMNYKMSMEMGQGMKMDMLMVNDGEFVWTEMKGSMMPQVMVTKAKSTKAMGERDPLDNVKKMWDTWDLKVTGEDTLDGQKMWVLEGTLKEGKTPAGKMQQQGTKVKMWLGQDDNFTHRFIVYDDKGNELGDTTFSNVKLNGKVDDGLFKYTPPAGAKVIDADKMGQGGPMGN